MAHAGPKSCQLCSTPAGRLNESNPGLVRPRRGWDACTGDVPMCASVYKAKLDRPHFTADLDRTVQREAKLYSDTVSPVLIDIVVDCVGQSSHMNSLLVL